MKRALFSVAAAVIAGISLLAASPAHAEVVDEFVLFDIQAVVDENGLFTVTQTMDIQFASPKHGIYVWFVTRQAMDSKHDRLLTYTNFKVTSPTGAPTATDFSRGFETISVRIGDPDVTVSGLHTYVITYNISGIVNPNVASSNMDEIYWNAIPSATENPISNAAVTITGPAEVLKTACYYGNDYQNPCDGHSFEDHTASFSQESIPAGSGLAVAAGWAIGTFPGATVDPVSTSSHPLSLADGGKVAAAIAGVLTIVAVWGVLRMRQAGRDEQFANVTPGELPHPGQKVETKREEITDAAVAFTPPVGIPPRLVGVIVREKTSVDDVTATIVDLAVRGYLHMEQGKGKKFTLTRSSASSLGLNPIDRKVYSGLFAKSLVVTRAQLAKEDFYETFSGFQTAIKNEFELQNWYKTNPRTITSAFQVSGFLIALVVAPLIYYIASTLAMDGILGIGWMIVPAVVLGVGMMIVSRRMPVRTPIGSAVAIQAFGFKKYLETAEADQISWEEGQDIFSEYLPYAVAFGCAQRWATLFEQLVAQGVAVPTPTWYSGLGPDIGFPRVSGMVGSIGGIGSAMNDSVRAHTAAQAASSGGSSGGSGFSGGGGGGGVGGGGSGSW
ncbi:MAG: DUF2207 domain-containing protein [Propionibacteriaceae bacterium]|nr:DUF2207 domain-containing protein [Propionibacteriaceae bacterium]